MSTLSFSLQRSSLALAQVHRYLEATKAGLTKCKSEPGLMLKQIDGKATYEGTDLTGSDTSYIVSLHDLLSSLEALMEESLWILLPGQTKHLPAHLEMRGRHTGGVFCYSASRCRC